MSNDYKKTFEFLTAVYLIKDPSYSDELGLRTPFLTRSMKRPMDIFTIRVQKMHSSLRRNKQDSPKTNYILFRFS